jgi:hypothetical protein
MKEVRRSAVSERGFFEHVTGLRERRLDRMRRLENAKQEATDQPDGGQAILDGKGRSGSDGPDWRQVHDRRTVSVWAGTACLVILAASVVGRGSKRSPEDEKPRGTVADHTVEPVAELAK